MEQMRKKKHERPLETGIPAELTAGAAPPPAATAGGVQVIWGPMVETLDLGEFTVGEAFRMLRAPFNIAPAVTALVNGSPVDADHRLGSGDVLEFARPAGEKGGTR